MIDTVGAGRSEGEAAMVRVELLGPVQVYAEDATPVEVGGVRLRMLLARLALEEGRTVPVDSLVDGLWAEQSPSDSANALQALVSRLRRALRGYAAVESASGGYRLSVRAEDVDVHRFEALTARGRRELAAGRAGEASSLLATALGLWRGPALADVLDAPFAGPVATRLDGLRIAAAEDRWDAELRLGRYAEVLADLEAAGTERPLSERIAGLRMRALSAAGRQSDALAVYDWGEPEWRATTLPAGTSRSTPLSAVKSPYFFTSPSARIAYAMSNHSSSGPRRSR
jgi:DNA-binding SARP family transcriptional activator